MTVPRTPHPPVTVSVFAQRLTATPRGARLARHLAQSQLHLWGIPYGSDVSDAVAAVVAELAANAVIHARIPGRSFELRLSLVVGSVRVEVSDTCVERRPPGPADVTPPHPLAEYGRGLVLVQELADRWEVVDREPPGKTVRAEVDVPKWLSLWRG
ncbi:regulatory protein [Streptomyces davaonensis JCM 4913]|uniref:Regulatory protein n=1 Tax=Streptomyces davaonensis (strain DSM 101723 / JCM 4913 / KCC S-0913 / 768) TaxID=1214101 RepID=K4RBY0_STRDJ|nr:ATP-binding protein [Streptomyces davaonensis]CCK30314.1 regulatory protein [Streptomyces davaonensis JCM 4913]